jgi:YVTN family beta-propeller protein
MKGEKMVARSFLLVVSVAVACAPTGTGTPWSPREVLVLGSEAAVTTVEAATSRVVWGGEGIPSLGDWTTVFTTSPSGSSTLVRARDALTGEVVSTVRVPGELSVRVASADGSRAALLAPLPEGHGPWVPQPRASTEIAVVDFSEGGETIRYRLAGNVEPEAFSVDGRSLFLIRFVPSMDPEAYRVASLDLETGRVRAVWDSSKTIVETMSGTRLEQLASPDGTMLYTLYTTQPAPYTGRHAHGDSVVGFVHTLSLADGWAHCVPLPRELWGSDPADEAMAVSPDGRHLYVVDTARDLVAVMDTRRLEVVDTVPLDLGSTAGAEAHAVAAADGTLFVAAGSTVMSLHPGTLEPRARWTTDAAVTALGSEPEGLYVAMQGSVALLDPSTGRGRGTIPAPPLPDLAFVAMVDR